MSEKNLPIVLVLPKESDMKPNIANGRLRFFCEVTPELQEKIVSKFENVLNFYDDVFSENELVPAVGKITVKPEAIAKSYKPNDLCKNCPIIGSADLSEIYVKLTKTGIQKTIDLVRLPTSEKIRANLTVIADIQPVRGEEKISKSLLQMSSESSFNKVKDKIKIKLFDFNDELSDGQILEYVTKKLAEFGFEYKLISYGDKIKYIKLRAKSYEDIEKISSINGVKSVDFFQEYSLPLAEFANTDLQALLDGEHIDSKLSIGIIDGGISDDNPYLQPYIIAREEYVPHDYQNHKHATFIASTIQYGNQLNKISSSSHPHFQFVDIVAIPNADKNYGLTDTLSEESLMEIMEEVMDKYSASTKIWNLSLGIENKICNGSMSDLGIFLDYIQDKYDVQIFVSAGNLNQLPLRKWPAQNDMGDCDRIVSPADSVRSVTVGSIALNDSVDSIVKKNEPSPFSRRGPGANFIVKPDLVDYGGNCSATGSATGIGMIGLDTDGHIVEGIGTSYSTPRIVQKFASVYDEMMNKDLLLSKAMLIHSARMHSEELPGWSSDNIKYFGYGMPPIEKQDIMKCSKDEITLVFNQKVIPGSHLEMFDFPYPSSLIREGKCFGEIWMTLAYNPPLDENYGQEYCRADIDASFGVYWQDTSGHLVFNGCVPLEKTWDNRSEKACVDYGFKWSPIKSYHRLINNGIQAKEGWKIRIDMILRNGMVVPFQKFVLIITIKDSSNHDIYSEVVNGLRNQGYIINNLETRQQIRQRQ